MSMHTYSTKYFLLIFSLLNITQTTKPVDPITGSAGFFNQSSNIFWQTTTQGLPTLFVWGLYKIASNTTIKQKFYTYIEIEGGKSIISRFFGSLSSGWWNCIETFSRGYFMRPSKMKKAYEEQCAKKREEQIKRKATKAADHEILHNKLENATQKVAQLENQLAKTQDFFNGQYHIIQTQNSNLIQVTTAIPLKLDNQEKQFTNFLIEQKTRHDIVSSHLQHIDEKSMSTVTELTTIKESLQKNNELIVSLETKFNELCDSKKKMADDISAVKYQLLLLNRLLGTSRTISSPSIPMLKNNKPPITTSILASFMNNG